MTKAQLERQVAEQAEKIAKLEEEKQGLENEADMRDGDNDVLEEAAGHFAELVQTLPLRYLPTTLQLSFETLAECLGVALPLRR